MQSAEQTHGGHVDHRRNRDILALLEHIEKKHGDALIEHEQALVAIDIIVRSAAQNMHHNLGTYIPAKLSSELQTLETFLAGDATSRTALRQLLNTTTATPDTSETALPKAQERRDPAKGMSVQEFLFACPHIDKSQDDITVTGKIANKHIIEDKLQHALAQLKKGNLMISYDRKSAIKIEEACGDGFLVGLHTMTDNRLYGYYNPLSKTITWLAVAKNHNAWGRTIQNFREAHKRYQIERRRTAI